MQLELAEIDLINAFMPTIAERIKEQIESVKVLTESGHLLLEKYEKNLKVHQTLNHKIQSLNNYAKG